MRLSGWQFLLLLLPLGLVRAVRQLEENQSSKNDNLPHVRPRSNKNNASADQHRHIPGVTKKNGRRPTKTTSADQDSDDYVWLDGDTSEAIDSSETTAVESVRSSGDPQGKCSYQLEFIHRS